jgi:hypothetical protein
LRRGVTYLERNFEVFGHHEGVLADGVVLLVDVLEEGIHIS